MIRQLEKTDIDEVMQIWLDSNKEALNFIPAEYWENNFLFVKNAASGRGICLY